MVADKDVAGAAAPVAAVERQQAFVVVGAGRSGTSAVTRGLDAIGIDLGNHLKAGTAKNARGFFEDRELLEVIYRLREALGFKRSGAGVGIVPRDAYERPEIQPILDEAVRVLRTRFGDRPLWGFKAGGAFSFLPFFERVFQSLDVDVRYVLALRNPLSVAHSRRKVSLRRGSQINTDLEFLARIVPGFREAARHPLVVVEFDHLMADAEGELSRLAESLGLELTTERRRGIEAYARDFLSVDLRHHAAGEAELRASSQVYPLARDAYLLLADVARGERRLSEPDFWADWAEIERAHAQLAPILSHVDALEAELRATRHGLAGAPLWLRDVMRHAWHKRRTTRSVEAVSGAATDTATEPLSHERRRTGSGKA